MNSRLCDDPAIVVACPRCSLAGRVRFRLLPHVVRCPRCGVRFWIGRDGHVKSEDEARLVRFVCPRCSHRENGCQPISSAPACIAAPVTVASIQMRTAGSTRTRRRGLPNVRPTGHRVPLRLGAGETVFGPQRSRFRPAASCWRSALPRGRVQAANRRERPYLSSPVRVWKAGSTMRGLV